MKPHFLLLAFLFSASYCQSQVPGIGFGTAGVNIKPVPFHQIKLIGRINPTYSSMFQGGWTINGNLMAGYNFLSEDTGDMYVGLGLGTATTEFAKIVEEQRWYLNLPVGMELFPFASRRISLAAEMGPQLDIEGNSNERRLAFKGLFEFSLYL